MLAFTIVISTTRHLADGREIVYFDSTEHARDAVDTRDLPPVATRSQVRWDPLLGEWVVIAAHRQTRTFLPPTDQCPLCASTPARATEVPEAQYEVAVFENRFPSLSLQVDRDVPAHADGAPLVTLRPGEGRCEVIVFTSDHDRSFVDLGAERARLVVDAWAQRTEVLTATPGVEQVYLFENHGEEIGVTLAHPHGQVYAYPFLAPRVQKVLTQVAAHRAVTGGDLLAEVVEAERTGPRVVTSNEHWTAFVPGAARWPYELHLFPHRRVPDVAALTDAERDAFVEVYLDVLGRFAHRFEDPMNYISSWNQAPVRQTVDGAGRDDWWLHLQLFSFRRAPGKLKYLAGSESGMGAFVSDTSPEGVAEELRAVVLP